MTDIARLQEGLLRVRERFLDDLDGRERVVKALRMEISSTGNPGPSRDAAQRQLHRIAGTAATLGLPELGQAASICEDELVQVQGGKAFDADRTEGMLQDVLRQISKARTGG